MGRGVGVSWGFLCWLPAGVSQWVTGGVPPDLWCLLGAWGSRFLSFDPGSDSCPGSQGGPSPDLLGLVAGSAPAGPVHLRAFSLIPTGVWPPSWSGPGAAGHLTPSRLPSPKMGEFNEKKATCGTVCLKYLLFTYNCCFWVSRGAMLPTPHSLGLKGT